MCLVHLNNNENENENEKNIMIQYYENFNKFYVENLQ